jgi:outer membrane murein-binding lipoprotein Lpp
LALVTAGGFGLSACSNDAGSEATPSAVATLANHDEVVKAVGALSAAVDDLNSAVAGFDGEDWKDVVPGVKAAASDVDDALEKLRQIMSGKSVG